MSSFFEHEIPEQNSIAAIVSSFACLTDIKVSLSQYKISAIKYLYFSNQMAASSMYKLARNLR